MLVHNEDRFLRQAAENVLGFCDRLLIAEHRSTDGTLEIAQDLAARYPQVEVHRITDPRQSNEMLRPLAGTRTWVLGIDGDELYDIEGLRWTRAMIESGAWDRWWVVFGNVLNCVSLDTALGTAQGYLAPPCRSMTKLYNFAAVQKLDPDAPQRLMGRKDVFNEGYHALLRYDLHQETPWEDARFRCLHTCFLPRSSAETHAPAAGRENLTELSLYSPSAWLRRLGAFLRGRSAASSYKLEKYRRGPLVTVDARPFFP